MIPAIYLINFWGGLRHIVGGAGRVELIRNEASDSVTLVAYECLVHTHCIITSIIKSVLAKGIKTVFVVKCMYETK